jgi:hypothetical protein
MYLTLQNLKDSENLKDGEKQAVNIAQWFNSSRHYGIAELNTVEPVTL